MSMLTFTVEYNPGNPGLAASMLRQFANQLDGYDGPPARNPTARLEKPATNQVAADDEGPKKRGRKPKAKEEDTESDVDFGDMDGEASDLNEDDETDAFDPFDEINEMESKKKQPAKKSPQYTSEDVRKAALAYVKDHGRDKAVKLLKTFGADNPATLAEKHWAAFIAKCEK